MIINPPYARGPARAAPATWPYNHPTLAEVDKARQALRWSAEQMRKAKRKTC
jgi:hypothetical protein